VAREVARDAQHVGLAPPEDQRIGREEDVGAAEDREHEQEGRVQALRRCGQLRFPGSRHAAFSQSADRVHSRALTLHARSQISSTTTSG
jgi:hypothetical protein